MKSAESSNRTLAFVPADQKPFQRDAEIIHEFITDKRSSLPFNAVCSTWVKVST